MGLTRSGTSILTAALLLSACSFTDDSLWPSLTGEDPAGKATTAQPAPAAPPPRQTAQASAAGGVQAAAGAGQAVSAQPQLGSGDFTPPGVTPGQATGTYVGKQVEELRNDLQRLQGSLGQQNGQLQQLRTVLVENSQRYHGTIAAVNARLQVGTTPGNPILVQQFKSAQSDLDRIAQDIDRMNNLLNAVANNSTLSTYLSESARAAFGVSGAVDEDHRQLAILEDETNRTAVLIDRLLKEVTEDVRRQTSYVSSERSNLNLMSAGIKSGEIYGGSLINKAMASAGPSVAASGPLDTTGRRPLVVVRFDRQDVPYQQALYSAVSKVLERRPNALFDLVAVAPAAGGAARVALNSNKARRHAENVLRSLSEMGLPPARVAVSAKTQPGIKTNEVHLYLR